MKAEKRAKVEITLLSSATFPGNSALTIHKEGVWRVIFPGPVMPKSQNFHLCANDDGSSQRY